MTTLEQFLARAEAVLARVEETVATFDDSGKH